MAQFHPFEDPPDSDRPPRKSTASHPPRLPHLARLDPWSFVQVDGVPWGVDVVVVGSTGAFVIRYEKELATALAGRRRDLRSLRAAFKRTRNALGHGAVYLDVHAVVAVDAPFAPRRIRDVHAVPASGLTSFIADRKRMILPHQVERAAAVVRRAIQAPR